MSSVYQGIGETTKWVVCSQALVVVYVVAVAVFQISNLNFYVNAFSYRSNFFYLVRSFISL